MGRRRVRLVQLRKAAGHTQRSLAENLLVKETTVRRWEAGTSEPQPWRRDDLARELRVSPEELDRALTAESADSRSHGPLATNAFETPFHADLLEDASVDAYKGVLSVAEARARKFTQSFGSSGLNNDTLEQVYDDVAQVTFDYQRRPLTELLGDVTTAQETVFGLLEQRQRPAQARHLFFLGGVVSGILSKASHDLMNPHGAMLHARTAFLCADQADHDGLRSWVRGLQSLISYWAGRPREALRFAESGAAFASAAGSSMSVWLPSSEARAWAALGNASEAVAAIGRAENALATSRADELDELGGLCTFGPVRQRYYAADALAWLPREANRAASYATEAVTAFEDTTGPEWAFGDQAGSHSNLAIARAAQGEREGVVEALRPVLDLAPELRINGIVTSTRRAYDVLRRSVLADSTADVQEEIETFARTPLPALWPGDG